MTKMKADELPCPKCKEPIKASASRCKHCGYEISPEDVEQRIKLNSQSQKFALGCIAVLGLLFFLAFCTGNGSKSTDSDSAQNAASIEEKRKGFHCLSAWDGSHRGFSEKVKAQLRDPSSFEHVETKVTPEKAGSHGIVMRYRARNGFGGMNVGTAIGSYSHVTCDASEPIMSE
jgi:hypothetical protein